MPIDPSAAYRDELAVDLVVDRWPSVGLILIVKVLFPPCTLNWLSATISKVWFTVPAIPLAVLPPTRMIQRVKLYP